MKNLFAAALVGFAPIFAQKKDIPYDCDAGDVSCQQKIIDLDIFEAVPPEQEVALPDLYSPYKSIGPGAPFKGSVQFGSDYDKDTRIGYAENS